MKSPRMIILLPTLAVFALFVACSSDGGPEYDDSGTAGQVAGTVANAEGEPVADARVIAMERETSEKFETLSQEDGAYALPLPIGSYDLGFDDSNGHATCFTGPVVVGDGSSVELDVQFPEGGADDDAVYGTISHDGIADLSGWTVEFVSKVGRNDQGPLEATIATLDAQGAFAATVSGERMMDIDIYDETGTLVEFVDFAKLPGPCRLDFTVGTDTPNLYRHSREAGDPIPAMEAGKRVARSRFFAAHTNDVFSMSCSQKTETDSFFDTNTYTLYDYHLIDGKLGVGGGHVKLDTWNWGGSCDQFSQSVFSNAIYQHNNTDDMADTTEFDIEVKDDGSWWYDYAIHVCAYGPLYEDITFEDETHDTYSLEVDDPGWHWHDVNYNSHHPTLIEIKVHVKSEDYN